MATPTFTLLNHQLLTTADTSTGWNDLTTADTDIKVEGANSMSGVFRADGEQGYYDAGTAPVTAAGKTLRGWILTNNLPYMGTMASDPYKLLMYDGTTTQLKNLFGSDTYPGGWYNYIWDCDDFTSLTLANVRRWGVEAGHATNAKNVVNTWMDVIRYLDGYSMTGGTSGDKVRFSNIAALDKVSAYGVCSEINSVFFATGTIQFGTGATAHYFEMDGQILVFTEQMVPEGLYSLSGVGTGTNIVIQNSVIRAVVGSQPTRTRFAFDFDDADLASFSCTDNLLVHSAACYFKSGQTVTGNTFDDCGPVYAAGADLTGCVFKNHGDGITYTAGSSALVWNVATDPDGYLDDTEYVKGSVATHAIEFGTASPTSITLRGLTFSGYNASNGQNDSTFLVSRTSGTVTINLVGCNGNSTYTSAGATVVLVQDPVTTTVTVRDINDNSLIEGARVLLIAADGTGDLPYQESVTITRGSDTATFDERFEGTGYEETWSQGETVTGSAVLNEDFATSSVTGAPSSWDSQCLNITIVAGEDSYVEHRFAADDPILYARQEIIVASCTLSNGQFQYISTLADSAGNALCHTLLYRNGSGVLRLESAVYHDGSANSYGVDMSFDTNYIVELYWNTTDDEWEIRYNESSLGSGSLTGVAVDRELDRIRLGVSAGGADYPVNYYVDNVMVSPTTWPSLTGTSVATVSHTGHGLSTGDIAYIVGADQQEYNGAREITVTGANSYTYTVAGTPTTPATGTITSTGGLFNDLTNASGIVTDTRSWSNAQPFTGRIRKSSGSPYYGTTPLNGTISTTAGFSGTFYLIPDE